MNKSIETMAVIRDSLISNQTIPSYGYIAKALSISRGAAVCRVNTLIRNDLMIKENGYLKIKDIELVLF